MWEGVHVCKWEGVRVWIWKDVRRYTTWCVGEGVPGDSVEEVRARRWGGWDEVY